MRARAVRGSLEGEEERREEGGGREGERGERGRGGEGERGERVCMCGRRGSSLKERAGGRRRQIDVSDR
jgi:hypothetical protein